MLLTQLSLPAAVVLLKVSIFAEESAVFGAMRELHVHVISHSEQTSEVMVCDSEEANGHKTENFILPFFFFTTKGHK